MEVILDEERCPQGIFVSLKEWEHLKQSVDVESELYRLMEELTEKDVFDMKPEEFAAHLAPVAEMANKTALEEGHYLLYAAGEQGPPKSFIHQYSDRKILIQVDGETGKEHFLKTL
jgi:hypothetical protein